MSELNEGEEVTETWVRSKIDAAHTDMWRGGNLHGHSWVIWACFNGSPLRDARLIKQQLDAITERFDHHNLDELLSDTSGENLARTIGRSLDGCLEVIVERENFKAVWRKR
jgi:6-pyruvoyl-tetrahydropterin synthase